ncbi:zinc finger protein castor homolog 1-like [Lolium rigidum]|uniref:zinc finger protein castor homolog 1-like n=1 Tax=Lolium rigidum TaxID=89674 RepID=UPI001F5D5157|nr:zinc finger protein castor homolog 1-like [Lolium rigidum]
MQRAAAWAASLAIRRFASSACRPAFSKAATSLLPATAVLSAGTRLSLQPTAAAAAAALCARRGYAGGARKAKAAVSEDEDEEDDEFEAMGSDGEFDGDFDEEDLEDDDSEDCDDEPVKKRGRC